MPLKKTRFTPKGVLKNEITIMDQDKTVITEPSINPITSNQQF